MSTSSLTTLRVENDDIVGEGEVESPIPKNTDTFEDAGAAFVLKSKGISFLLLFKSTDIN